MVTTNSQVLLTADGWRRLHDELAELSQRRATSLAATMNGDWGPPSEHAASPSELEYLRHCIAELEYVLERAIPVARTEREPGVVGVGSEVEVHRRVLRREIDHGTRHFAAFAAGPISAPAQIVSNPSHLRKVLAAPSTR